MRRIGRDGVIRRAVAASLAMSMALCGLAPATAAIADELVPQADDQIVSSEVVDAVDGAESGENDQLPGDVDDADVVNPGETVDGEGDVTDPVPSDPQDPEPSDPSDPAPDVPGDTEPSLPTDPSPETPAPGDEGEEAPTDPEEGDEEGETSEEIDELDDSEEDEEAEARAKAEAAADLAAEHRGDLADGTYALRVSNSSSAVLDVQGASSAPGAKVNLWSRKSTGDNQLWSVTHDEDGFVKLTNISSGLVLGVSSAAQGSRTMQLEDNGDPTQRWVAVKDGSSFKFVSAADASLVLDARHASTANGTWVELYADNGTSNQRWVAAKTATLRESLDALAASNVSGAILAPGSYAIEPAHATKLALDVQGGSNSSGAKVNLWTYGGRSNQVWNVSMDSKGYVTISNLKSGLVLDASGSIMRQATPDESSWNQKWIVMRDGLGIKLVSAVDGTRVLDVRRAGSTNGTETILYSDTGAVNQRWRFVGANANRALINDLANTHKGDLKDGTYYVRLEGSDGAVLDVQGGSMSNSAKVNLWGKKVSANQAWTVTHDSQGYVTLTNYGSGKALDVQGSSASNGARLIQYTSNGGWNQKWIAIKEGSSYKLVSAMDPGFVLNAHEGSSANGTWTEIMPESNGAGQGWSFEWFNISQLLSERQLRLIEAAKSTPSPGPGLCAAWVTNAFINAGVGYFWGDACDMYDDWCHTSVSFIKPGMIIAVDKSPTPAGRIWGHVGIYIGDGKVMHSTGDFGEVQTWTLDEWLDTYDELATPKCGWMGGLDLSR